MRVIAAALVIGLALHGVASAETIELKNGDKLEGVTVLEKSDDSWIVEHGVFGKLEVPTDQIKPPEEKKVIPGLFGTSFLEGWKKQLSAGLNGSSGVTKALNFNAGLRLNNETERHRDAFEARYIVASADSNTESDNFTASHLHDFLFPDTRWFMFLGGSYKYDRFQDWSHRVVGAGGVGYDFLKDDVYTLTGRIGPGFTVTREDGRGPLGKNPPPVPLPVPPAKLFDRRPNPEREDFNAVFGLAYTWAIVEGVGFSWDANYFPVLNDTPEFRAISTAELKVAIGYIDGLALALGGSYEYDSQNAQRNDRRFFGNIVYDF